MYNVSCIAVVESSITAIILSNNYIGYLLNGLKYTCIKTDRTKRRIAPNKLRVSMWASFQDVSSSEYMPNMKKFVIFRRNKRMNGMCELLWRGRRCCKEEIN